MKVKLGEVFENVINGDWGDEPTGNNDVAIIRTTNFTNDGIINYNNVVYRQIKKDIVLKKKLIYGDIIIEKSGGSDNFPVGRVVYYDKIDEIYLCNNFTSILRTNKELVVSKYLLYLMLNLYKRGITTKFQTKTTGIRNLQLTSYLANTEITIHDIQIQKEIVSILDKVTSLISMRKEQLEKLDILIKSKFIEMFGDPVLNPKGWEKKKLGEVLKSLTTGLNPRKFFKLNTEDAKNYYVTIRELKSGTLYFNSKTDMVNDDALKLINGRSNLEKDDILFTGTGTIGETYIIRSKPNNWNIKEGVYSLKPIKEYITPYYIKILFAMENLKKEYSKFIVGGTVKSIPMRDLNLLIVPIPPLELQNQFAEFVEQVEKNKENIKSSLNQLEILYSALMQEYFG